MMTDTKRAGSPAGDQGDCGTPSHAEPVAAPGAEDRQGRHVLVADDERSTRLVLERLLCKQGYRVQLAGGGAEAWNILRQDDAPQLVLLDRMMPRMDGIEVCHKIRSRSNDRRTYIIMVTVLGDSGEVAAGLDAGADDYVVKPVVPDELRARVDVGWRLLTIQNQLVTQAAELRAALAQVKTLRGFIPICCGCKRIRDDQDYWREVEEYISEHTEAHFSHGLCPECLERLYPA